MSTWVSDAFSAVGPLWGHHRETQSQPRTLGACKPGPRCWCIRVPFPGPACHCCSRLVHFRLPMNQPSPSPLPCAPHTTLLPIHGKLRTRCPGRVPSSAVLWDLPREEL